MRDPSPQTLLAALLGEIAATDHRLTYIKCARDAETLHRIGKRCRKLCARETREQVDPDETRRMRNKWRDEAAGILKFYGVLPQTIETDGDPRGFCLKWRFPSCPLGVSRGNDMGEPNVWGV